MSIEVDHAVWGVDVCEDVATVVVSLEDSGEAIKKEVTSVDNFHVVRGSQIRWSLETIYSIYS